MTTSTNMEEQFIKACKDGSLGLAQQLFSNYTDDCIKHACISFRWACFNGHLQVARWLLSVNPDMNISADYDPAFEYDAAFRFACLNGHLHVAQWLQTLKPYLYVINYNQDGTYKSYQVRTKQQET